MGHFSPGVSALNYDFFPTFLQPHHKSDHLQADGIKAGQGDRLQLGGPQMFFITGPLMDLKKGWMGRRVRTLSLDLISAGWKFVSVSSRRTFIYLLSWDMFYFWEIKTSRDFFCSPSCCQRLSSPWSPHQVPLLQCASLSKRRLLAPFRVWN